MKLTKLKQGTLAWEKARDTRIGSSEIFDIVRYYATDEELQNCGINAEHFKAEKPYTTTWALYHKMLNDGLYKREELAPEFAEYGHSVEPYGVNVLQKNRNSKLKPALVYIDERLIASLDISGVAEERDIVNFDYGYGTPKIGQKFVCEQKTMMPQVIKSGIPFKYIVQAQYQILKTKADFFILQLMVLKEDTPFLRGKICQMSRNTKFKYLADNMTVTHLYFQNNEHLSRIIEECLNRFFNDVDKRKEPTPFIEYDSQQNIIESIRLNSEFNSEKTVEYNLSHFMAIKEREDNAKAERQKELQKIIELAKENNAVQFISPFGYSGAFSKNGRFLTKENKNETVSISR